MCRGLAFIVLLFALCSPTDSFTLVNGSLRTTVRTFLQRWGPSRPLYQPTKAEKEEMMNLFSSYVGASLISTLQDKMERFTLWGMGKPKPVKISCPNNVQITGCKASYLYGLSTFTQESEFNFKDEGRYMVTFMAINFRTIMSESYIQYTTHGLIHNDIRGIYYLQPRDEQKVKIKVTLERKWYFWIIPSYCFIYISRIEYPAIQGAVMTSLERKTFRHLSRGKRTLSRHPMINTIMEHHLRGAIPRTVILTIDDVLDDYRRNSYVCKT